MPPFFIPETRITLPTLPDDCLAEAFGELTPADLLALRVCCCVFKHFLMDRGRSRHIWRRALRNVPDLPPCPRTMTEIAYAKLCFEEICFNCLSKCSAVEWDLRVRVCCSCSPDFLIACEDWTPPLFILCSSFCVDDFIHVRAPSYGSAFLSSDLAAIHVKYEQLNAAQRVQFVATRKAEMVEDRVHARTMRGWHIHHLQQKAKVDAEIRADRFAAIYQNLLILDWDEELEALGKRLSNLRLVRMVEPLTDESWSDIYPYIYRYLCDFRARENERKQKELAAAQAAQAAHAAKRPRNKRCKVGQW